MLCKSAKKRPDSIYIVSMRLVHKVFFLYKDIDMVKKQSVSTIVDLSTKLIIATGCTD